MRISDWSSDVCSSDLATVIGIDLYDPALAEEWRQRGGMGAFADVMCLPFPDDSFDLVLGIEVLEHVPVPDRALSEIRRVGRESFVLSVPREPICRMANLARGRHLPHPGTNHDPVTHWPARRYPNLDTTHPTH